MAVALVFARSANEVPGWAMQHHDWQTTTDITKLKKLEVKMRLCCNSCEDNLGDEIREMRGVFDVKTDKTNDTLTVYESPGEGPNSKLLLKKLKRVDRRAQIVKRVGGEDEAEEEEEGNVRYVAVPVLAPGMMPWPPFGNYNYVQHRVSCGQCWGYSDAVCSNCGRRSELGAL